MQEYFLKSYIETRAVEIANYIVENNATVRQAAKQFGISKSTVHKDITDADRLLRIDRSLPQRRVTFSISTSPNAISAADLPPERSICICLMCMPAECILPPDIFMFLMFTVSHDLLAHRTATCPHRLDPHR